MLDTEERFGDLRPEDLLARAGLGRRQTVVDVGCGPGLLALAAAAVVRPLGKVYAVDIEQKMLDLVSSRAATEGAANIVTVFSAGARVPLPDQTADFVICSQVLHYPTDPGGRAEMARDVRRLVRPDGRVLVIEWAPQDGDDPASRLSPEDTEEILGRAGLRSENRFPVGQRQYAIVARPGGQSEQAD